MVSKRRNDNRSFTRERPKRARRYRIFVVCEGRVTEPRYLRAFQHHCRNSRVHVHVHDDHGVPLTVVRIAVEARNAARRAAKAQQDDNLDFDAVWVVFDVDDHPNLTEALELAERENLRIALSNPCFELWALLHFEDHRKHIARKALASRLRAFLEDYEKELDFAKLHEGYANALKRANALDLAAATNGKPRCNPTTGVHQLTEMIRLK